MRRVQLITRRWTGYRHLDQRRDVECPRAREIPSTTLMKSSFEIHRRRTISEGSVPHPKPVRQIPACAIIKHMRRRHRQLVRVQPAPGILKIAVDH